MADSSNSSENIGVDAWLGKSVSAETKASVSVKSDIPPPQRHNSVISVPEEHRFDRVPPPAKNHSPKPQVPVDTYYERYNEMMERAGLTADKPDENRLEKEPVYYPLPNDQAENNSQAESLGQTKERIFNLVKSGTPVALYDETVIPLLENGLVKLAFSDPVDGIRKVVAVSTKDGMAIREVGYARGSEKNQSIN